MGTITIPFRSNVTVQKWPDGVDPDTNDPEETVEAQVWYENGEPVFDLARISELEASVAGEETP